MLNFIKGLVTKKESLTVTVTTRPATEEETQEIDRAKAAATLLEREEADKVNNQATLEITNAVIAIMNDGRSSRNQISQYTEKEIKTGYSHNRNLKNIPPQPPKLTPYISFPKDK